MIKFPANIVPSAWAIGAATRQTATHQVVASVHPFVTRRFTRHQAFDAHMVQEDLDEARKWHASYARDSIPKGHTTYARSSGPGGQHVNKCGAVPSPVCMVSD